MLLVKKNTIPTFRGIKSGQGLDMQGMWIIKGSCTIT